MFQIWLKYKQKKNTPCHITNHRGVSSPLAHLCFRLSQQCHSFQMLPHSRFGAKAFWYTVRSTQCWVSSLPAFLCCLMWRVSHICSSLTLSFTMSSEDDQTFLISQKSSCAVSLGGVKKKTNKQNPSVYSGKVARYANSFWSACLTSRIGCLLSHYFVCFQMELLLRFTT